MAEIDEISRAMRVATQEVTENTREQRKAGEPVVSAAHRITLVARENADSALDIAGSAEALVQNAESLNRRVQGRLGRGASPVLSVRAKLRARGDYVDVR